MRKEISDRTRLEVAAGKAVLERERYTLMCNFWVHLLEMIYKVPVKIQVHQTDSTDTPRYRVYTTDNVLLSEEPLLGFPSEKLRSQLILLGP